MVMSTHHASRITRHNDRAPPHPPCIWSPARSLQPWASRLLLRLRPCCQAASAPSPLPSACPHATPAATTLCGHSTSATCDTQQPRRENTHLWKSSTPSHCVSLICTCSTRTFSICGHVTRGAHHACCSAANEQASRRRATWRVLPLRTWGRLSTSKSLASSAVILPALASHSRFHTQLPAGNAASTRSCLRAMQRMHAVTLA
jgi:hypothetical protein